LGYRWGEDAVPLLACNDGAQYDVAICSECLWKADNHQVLVTSLTKTVKLGGLAYVGFSHHHPGREEIDLQFFEIAKSQGWVVQATHTLQVSDQWNVEKKNQFYIYELIRML
jgi:predicted nicotinamide N-methyase